MIRDGLLFGILVAAALSLGAAVGCYATTGPVPSCAANPYQPQCPPPIHDERKPDGGR